MIELRNTNQERFILNCDLIETIEFIPETKITLIGGKYLLVLDSAEEIIEKTIQYNQRIYGTNKSLHIIQGE